MRSSVLTSPRSRTNATAHSLKDGFEATADLTRSIQSGSGFRIPFFGSRENGSSVSVEKLQGKPGFFKNEFLVNERYCDIVFLAPSDMNIKIVLDVS